MKTNARPILTAAGPTIYPRFRLQVIETLTPQLEFFRSPKFIVALAFLAVYLGWGTTYLAIRIGVQDTGPAAFLAYRYLIAAFCLAPVLYFRGEFRETRRSDAVKSGFMGCCLLIGGLLPTAYAEKSLPSSLVAVVIGTAPVMFAFFDWLLNRKIVHALTLLGAVFGITGILLLASSGESAIGLAGHINSIILVLMAMTFWSYSSVISRELKTASSLLLGMFWQYVAAGFVLLLVSTGLEGTSHLNPFTWRQATFMSCLYLAILPSLVSYYSYLWLLKNQPSQRVATYAMINPAVAVAVGFLLLDEVVTWQLIAALILVVLGTVLIFLVPKKTAQKISSAA